MHPELKTPRGLAIILGAGDGDRFGRTGGKQMFPFGDSPLLSHTIAAFDRARSVGFMIVMCHPERQQEYEVEAVAPYAASTGYIVAPGGATRQDSVGNGIDVAISLREYDILIIHDGARPLVTPELIDSAVDTLVANEDHDGVVVGHPAYDTIKRVRDGIVVETLDREGCWHAQTPQVFWRDKFEDAFARTRQEGIIYTDDESVMSAAGYRVGVHLGPRENFKITVPEDVSLASAVFYQRKDRS